VEECGVKKIGMKRAEKGGGRVYTVMSEMR